MSLRPSSSTLPAASVLFQSDGDLDVGGPMLASAFIQHGLVDEYRLLVHPVVLGSGTPFFPSLESRIGLRFVESRIFESGVVYLHYGASRR